MAMHSYLKPKKQEQMFRHQVDSLDIVLMSRVYLDQNILITDSALIDGCACQPILKNFELLTTLLMKYFRTSSKELRKIFTLRFKAI